MASPMADRVRRLAWNTLLRGKHAGPAMPDMSRPYDGREYSYESGIRTQTFEKLREFVGRCENARFHHGRPDWRGRTAVHVRVDHTGRCERPIGLHWRANAVSALPPTIRAYHVTHLVRCKKCRECKALRAWQWSEAAERMYDATGATWLCTFTMSPIEHARLDMRRRKAFGPDDLFKARCEVFSKELTKWLKRVRDAEYKRRRKWFFEESTESRELRGRAEFTYMMVAEPHDGPKTSDWLRGRPHFHLALHEAEPGELIHFDEAGMFKNPKTGKLELRARNDSMVKLKWKFGHCSFVAAENAKGAKYLCKYVADNAVWRIRASIGYSEVPEEVPSSDAVLHLARPMDTRGVQTSNSEGARKESSGVNTGEPPSFPLRQSDAAVPARAGADELVGGTSMAALREQRGPTAERRHGEVESHGGGTLWELRGAVQPEDKRQRAIGDRLRLPWSDWEPNSNG